MLNPVASAAVVLLLTATTSVAQQGEICYSLADSTTIIYKKHTVAVNIVCSCWL